MMTNEELPYEQQMLHILRTYDRITDENRALKEENARLKEELRVKAHYVPFCEYKNLRDLYDTKAEKIKWIQNQLTEYLKSLGVKLPKHRNVKSIVELITSICPLCLKRGAAQPPPLPYTNQALPQHG